MVRVPAYSVSLSYGYYVKGTGVMKEGGKLYRSA